MHLSTPAQPRFSPQQVGRNQTGHAVTTDTEDFTEEEYESLLDKLTKCFPPDTDPCWQVRSSPCPSRKQPKNRILLLQHAKTIPCSLPRRARPTCASSLPS